MVGGFFILSWEDHVIASEGIGDMAWLCLKVEYSLRRCVEDFSNRSLKKKMLGNPGEFRRVVGYVGLVVSVAGWCL